LEWFVQQCADIFGVPGLTPNIDGTNDVWILDSFAITLSLFVMWLI
jgi:hypothetical protein